MSEQTRASSIEIEERINAVKLKEQHETKWMEDHLKAVTLEKDYWMLQASAISTNFQAVAMQHQVSASSNQAPQQDWFDNEREKSELMSTVAITKADVDKFEKEKSLAELKIKLEQDKNSSLENKKVS